MSTVDITKKSLPLSVTISYTFKKNYELNQEHYSVNTSMFINIILSHTNKHVQNIKTDKEQQKLGDNFFVSSFFSSIHSFFLFEFFGFVIYMVIRCLEASGKKHREAVMPDICG